MVTLVGSLYEAPTVISLFLLNFFYFEKKENSFDLNRKEKEEKSKGDE
ncbi:MAG: hypothetical protein ACRCWZ_01225 [Cetobacterium sp.]